MEVNLIKIDGKPLEKLIEVVSKGIGKLYQPNEIRKIADAEAYKIEVISRAKVNAKVSAREIDVESELKIEQRLAFQEAKRQINIESVTYKVAEQLQNEIEVSDEPLDEDWITRFFDTVKDVSSEEMQTLWSRILAGEIKRPKSFSLRTLEFLKNLSQEDAQLLIKISKFTVTIGVTNLIFYKSNDVLFKEKWDLTYPDFLYLIELGIISSNDASITITDITKGAHTKLIYGNKAILVERKTGEKKLSITFTPFTKIGTELLKLIEKDTNSDYMSAFIKHIVDKRTDFAVKIGTEIIGKDGVGTKLYNNFEEIEV